jgi:hypothetical protein
MGEVSALWIKGPTIRTDISVADLALPHDKASVFIAYTHGMYGPDATEMFEYAYPKLGIDPGKSLGRLARQVMADVGDRKHAGLSLVTIMSDARSSNILRYDERRDSQRETARHNLKLDIVPWHSAAALEYMAGKAISQIAKSHFVSYPAVIKALDRLLLKLEKLPESRRPDYYEELKAKRSAGSGRKRPR